LINIFCYLIIIIILTITAVMINFRKKCLYILTYFNILSDNDE